MATECPLCGNEYERVTSHVSRSHLEKEYKSMLIKELKRLANEYDRTPTTSLMNSKGKFSSQPYIKNFGSWNEALKETGLEVNIKQDISKKELIKELQRVDREYDKLLTFELMKSEGEFSAEVYYNFFNSWNEALKEAGLKANNKRGISKDKLLKEIQRLDNEYDRTPTYSLMESKGKFSAETYSNSFGSWNKALREVGLEVNVNTDFNKNELIEELQRLDNEYDVNPSRELMKSEGKFGHSTYRRNFGSWNNALKEAGLKINMENNISKERLLEELQRLSDEYDVNLSRELMNSKGKFSSGPYDNVFGSWNNALKEAGLEVNVERNISKERLLEELQRLSDEYDVSPSRELMRSKGKFGSNTYRRTFGSWNNALKEAALEINHENNISKERLLEELQRLDNEYEKTPSIYLMESEGKFTQQPYKRAFGSWNEALKEAGLEINNNNSMCGMEQSVYVLECGNSKYYVGASAHPDKRLRQHKNQGRSASSWATEHGVEERIYLSDPMPHEKAYQKEREKTLELMRKHGWENVRGSQWLSVELESPPEPLKINQKV
jgi:predicted GIY-YIG superfamily endonuclease/ribonuclease I